MHFFLYNQDTRNETQEVKKAKLTPESKVNNKKNMNVMYLSIYNLGTRNGV